VGDGCESVALLFGALHMRDMRSLLEKEFELLAAQETRWDTAWVIKSDAAARNADVLLLIAAAVLLVVDAGKYEAYHHYC